MHHAALGLVPASWQRAGTGRAVRLRWVAYFLVGGVSAATVGAFLVLVLIGCGALKELDSRHAEIKSMRTPEALRRRGAGRAILNHIIAVARTRGYQRLSLETGSTPAFRPAQKLYESAGFSFCGPFGEYREDPHSAYMTLRL